MAGPWFVFAGGGTGGHLFPAMSVARALRERVPGAEVTFFCTGKQMDRDILGRAGIEAVPQVVLPMPTRPWTVPRFLWRWRQSVTACMKAFRQRRPAAVVGAGGYASGPPVRAASALGVPAFLLNPDAVPGRANRHMARKGHVQEVFAQWEVTRRHFPANVTVTVSGCPVRTGFREVRDTDPGPLRQSFGLDPSRPALLVTGASQGARTINEAVIRLAAQIAAAGWQVLHLAGQADAPAVTKAAEEARATHPSLVYQVLPFTDRMPEAMAACDLVISRAGASTLSELQAAGRPSILLPYPYHRDQHQRHNAMVLVDAGAAMLLDDCRDGAGNAERLGPMLADAMGDAERRTRMGHAARGLDCPDAAGTIAEALAKA